MTSRTWSRVSSEEGAGERGAPRDLCPLLHCWAALHPAARTPMGDACAERGRGETGRASLEDRAGAAETCKSRGNSLSLSSPKDRATLHPARPPRRRGRHCPGPPDRAGGLSTGLAGIPRRPGGGCWAVLLGGVECVGGRGRMVLSQIQRHPSSLPEFLSSKTPRKFPQLPSLNPGRG